MASLPGSGVAWTVVAVKGFQSFYYVENRAPMSSSDVTGLLIGLPKARLFFALQCTIQQGQRLSVSEPHGSAHNNVYTQEKKKEKRIPHPRTGHGRQTYPDTERHVCLRTTLRTEGNNECFYVQ